MKTLRFTLVVLVGQLVCSCNPPAPESSPPVSTPDASNAASFGDTGSPAVPPERDALESPGGYRAEFVKGPAEGRGKTVVWQSGRKVAEIPDSRPVSFSPTADLLLLVEHEPDDDLRHYLLNIGAGELSKQRSRRMDYVFGGRYGTSASWSADGKTITLHYHPVSGMQQETFQVDQLLNR